MKKLVKISTRSLQARLSLGKWAFLLAGWALTFGAVSISSQPLSNLTSNCPQLQYEPQPQNWPSQFAANMANLGNVPDEFLDMVQSPLTAQQSIGCQVTPQGLQSLLWVSEDILNRDFKAWDITWDNRGRAWVAETYDYPNEKKNHGQGADRISILEDTDGDGVADQAKTFVDGLNMPYTLLHVKEGLVVFVRDRIVLFTDEDGDDEADSPLGTVLYDGFPSGDTHGTVTNFSYGMDNWVYASVGYNGIQATGHPLSGGTQSVDRTTNTGWIFRFKTDGTALEGLSPIGCNSAGMGITEDFEIFMHNATCGTHTMHLVYPGRRNNGVSSHGNSLSSETMDVNVWEGRYSFTATSGHNFYTARYFPEEYWNKATFINEGPYHIVHLDFIEQNGHTYRSNNENQRSNLLASTDAWTAPVYTNVGPDGAVWVIDWYNYIFLHNPAQPLGAGQAHITSIRDNTMSRIYRVTRTDEAPMDEIVDIGPNSPLLFVAARLGHSNMFWRHTAQVELLRRGVSTELLDILRGYLADRHIDGEGLGPLTAHALWTLHGLGVFQNDFGSWSDAVLAAAKHPGHDVRKAVAGVLPRNSAGATVLNQSGLLNDNAPGVRMAAALAARDMPSGSNLTMSSTNCQAAHMTNLMSGSYDNDWANLASSNATRADSRVTCGNGGATPTLDPGIEYSGNHPEIATPISSPKSTGSQVFSLNLLSSGMLSPAHWTDIEPGIVKVFAAEGSIMAEQSFDGKAFSGKPVPHFSGIRFFQYESINGAVIRGVLAGVN